jgi:uncharacterized protein YfdQ (DUF2303 family)
MNDINIPAIINAATELGAVKNQKPEVKIINGIECLVKPNGEVVPLVVSEKHLERPKRKRATASIYETVSFIDYVNRHKITGRTHIFGVATELGGGFTAILDYHNEEPKGEITVAPGEAPGWGQHVAQLELATTPEWKRWVTNNNKSLSQEAFAEHIEDNQLDIVEPAAADILDMAQLLQGKKTVTFKAGKNLRNGTVQLEYSEQIDAGRRDDAMVIPDRFKLGIIPFVGAFGVEIEGRIRFRIGDGGKLTFSYLLNRPYKVIEDAFKHTRHQIEAETGIKVMLGSATIHQA